MARILVPCLGSFPGATGFLGAWGFWVSGLLGHPGLSGAEGSRSRKTTQSPETTFAAARKAFKSPHEPRTLSFIAHPTKTGLGLGVDMIFDREREILYIYIYLHTHIYCTVVPERFNFEIAALPPRSPEKGLKFSEMPHGIAAISKAPETLI